jgi:hypothetical protein
MPNRRDRAETWICILAALMAGCFYLWTAMGPARPRIYSYRDPSGYYPLLTAGFRSGHLYAAIAPSPELLALPDPYDPVSNAPYRVHDMSLFRGHYYLYYGAAPVLLFFWPFVALTGKYPTEALATGLFCAGAVAAGIALLLGIRRRHFPGAPTLALVLAVACLGFATPLNLLAQSPQFYQVAISCGVFLQALMLWAAFRSLDSKRGVAWLSAAGLFFGLSVAARPNYMTGIIALLVVVAAKCRAIAGSDPKARRRVCINVASWALLPPALCGAALLLYNAMRFGSVFELGTHYQLAGSSVMNLQQFSLGNLVPHLGVYLFEPATWQTYFPFLASDSVAGYGIVRYLPWTWLAAAPFLRLGRSPAPEPGGRAIVRCIGAACAANLALLCCFVVTNVRYAGDFSNAGIILAGVGALAVGQWASQSRRPVLACAVLAVAAGVSLFNSFGAYADRLDGNGEFTRLGRAANWPLYAWQRSHGAEFGGLRLDLVLPEAHPDNPEPVFEMGRQADQRDWLQIEYTAPDRAQFSFFHAGAGAVDGREFAIPADRRVVVELHCGALLPPFSHPVYSGWSREAYDAARRELRISVNGNEVLRTALDCYHATPASFSAGRLKWPMGGMEGAFSGEIVSVKRLALAPPGAVERPADGVLGLGLILPAQRPSGAEPIMATGDGSRSDLLYCIYDGTGRLKFGLDHYGVGGPISEFVPYDPLVPHSAVVSMGTGAAPPGRLVVVFDGRTLIDSQTDFYPSPPGSAVLGQNRFGSTAALREFTGVITAVRPLGPGALPPRAAEASYGAVEMVVNFPGDQVVAADPLVVTGAPGMGDVVYVKYVDPGHIALGFDHWGKGGSMGDPVAIDYRVAHRIAITMDSLYASGESQRHPHDVRVLVDGELALQCTSPCFPSQPSQIRIGRNEIGGSTCRPKFAGDIVLVERYPQMRR